LSWSVTLYFIINVLWVPNTSIKNGDLFIISLNSILERFTDKFNDRVYFILWIITCHHSWNVHCLVFSTIIVCRLILCWCSLYDLFTDYKTLKKTINSISQSTSLGVVYNNYNIKLFYNALLSLLPLLISVKFCPRNSTVIE